MFCIYFGPRVFFFFFGSEGRANYRGTRQSAKYLGDGILARSIDNVVHRPLAADVIHTDELEKTRVDKAHAYAVPHVHGSQIRNDGQRSPEAIRRGEKVEHRCYTCKRNQKSAIYLPMYFRGKNVENAVDLI